MRQSRWFGLGRRLMLKARFRVERLHARVLDRLSRGDVSVPLQQVQRRLELLLTAVHGRPIPITATDDSLWTRERVRSFASRDPRARELGASADGNSIYLPPRLNARQGDDEAIARYRLFALEQAERIQRGTVVHASMLGDRLERDLYLLREGAAIDSHIARSHPGISPALREERKYALAQRPKLAKLTPAERDVEAQLRETLATKPDEVDAPSISPVASIAWARETAHYIRTRNADTTYRGLPLASIWGTLKAAEQETSSGNGDSTQSRVRQGATGSFLQEAPDRESPTSGASSSTSRDDKTTPNEGSSDAHNDQPSTRPQGAEQTQSHNGTGYGLDSIDPERLSSLETLPPAISYDEWDAHTGTYAKRAAAVRLYDSVEGDAEWSRTMLAAHAATVRQVRHQFERLRARRSLLSRQRAGDDLDLAACVHAIVDRRIGRPADDRLYVDARPARRGLAIALLVDVSGSTEARVTENLRIIDIERIALLLASEALDALGDLYAVYAFAGKNAFNVKVTPVKEFNERSGDPMYRRIAALQPGGFTRLGAAVRHATHRLARQSAGHRLLLILSDGRPNDVDRYQGHYGVEDSRQAIIEARASGVYPFCLTVDRDASEYLPRIFGTTGHTILQRAEQLPTALLRVVQALIRRR